MDTRQAMRCSRQDKVGLTQNTEGGATVATVNEMFQHIQSCLQLRPKLDDFKHSFTFRLCSKIVVK